MGRHKISVSPTSSLPPSVLSSLEPGRGKNRADRASSCFVSSSRTAPFTPPHFPLSPTLARPTQSQPTRPVEEPASDSEDDEEDWLVVRPKDATRTTSTNKLSQPDFRRPPSLSLETSFLSQPTTTKNPTVSTLPSRIPLNPQPKPRRSSTEPTATSTLSNRPLPPLPPPPYLRTISTSTYTSPAPPSDVATTFKASLLTGLDSDAKVSSTSPPPPPFRSHSSPATTNVTTTHGASMEPSDRNVDGGGGGEIAGSGRGGGGGAAKLRSLFFSGKLGGGKKKEKEDLMGLGYTRASAGKDQESSSEERVSLRLLFSVVFFGLRRVELSFFSLSLSLRTMNSTLTTFSFLLSISVS